MSKTKKHVSKKTSNTSRESCGFQFIALVRDNEKEDFKYQIDERLVAFVTDHDDNPVTFQAHVVGLCKEHNSYILKNDCEYGKSISLERAYHLPACMIHANYKSLSECSPEDLDCANIFCFIRKRCHNEANNRSY